MWQFSRKITKFVDFCKALSSDQLRNHKNLVSNEHYRAKKLFITNLNLLNFVKIYRGYLHFSKLMFGLPPPLNLRTYSNEYKPKLFRIFLKL